MFQDDEDDEQIIKIQIPKYKILHIDLDGGKKDFPIEVNNTMDRQNTTQNISTKKDEPKINYAEKILECKLI